MLNTSLIKMPLKVVLSITAIMAVAAIPGTAFAADEQTKSLDKMMDDKPAAEKSAADKSIPAPTMDTNKDGKMDAWDRDGNGMPDAWDVNGDGQPDQLDNNGDGKPDDDKASAPAPAPAPEPADPPR